MPTAEGRTIPFEGPEAIDVSVLETFHYQGPDQEIVTATGEFSAVCPFSGLPDFAILTISYVPSDRCVEFKSLKYYILSYRNVGIYQEHLVNRILKDLVRCCRPKWMRIEVDYNIRGGVHTTVVRETGRRAAKGGGVR